MTQTVGRFVSKRYIANRSKMKIRCFFVFKSSKIIYVQGISSFIFIECNLSLSKYFRYENDVDENRLIINRLIFALFEKESFESNFLQNKYAHLVNTLFLIDFPQQKWHNFFRDFLSRCKTQMTCTLFLRILVQINLDIADREIPRTAKVLFVISLLNLDLILDFLGIGT